jgi:hypothetical protein
VYSVFFGVMPAGLPGGLAQAASPNIKNTPTVMNSLRVANIDFPLVVRFSYPPTLLNGVLPYQSDQAETARKGL